MPTLKLTKAVIAKLDLPDDKNDDVFWDADLPGFGVRLRRQDRDSETRRAFYIGFRINGRSGREQLGDVRKVELDAARKIAKTKFAQIQLGKDPAAERLAAKVALKAGTGANAMTLGALTDRYLISRRDIVASTTHRDMTRYFVEAHWKPLRGRPADAITLAEIAARLQDIIVERGRVAASRARSYLSAAYAWGIGEGLVTRNPVTGSNVPDKDVPSRDRVLSDAELRTVWQATAGTDDYSKIIRLLILLGNRRAEIGGLRWSEIDLGNGTVTIPGERTKGGHTLTLTLPDRALAILRSVERRAGNDFVFGGNKAGFTGWSNAVRDLRARILALMASWTVHDIRRTFRSGLSEIGVQPHIAERLIGHSVGKKVQQTYDRFAYKAEMRDALLRWSEHVVSVVESRKGKVLPLKATA
jgi:integrase